MKQPKNSIERFAYKLTWKQSLFLYSIFALLFFIPFIYCCKMMLFNAVSCTILLLLFALTCISAYIAMLSTVYSIIKDNYKIKKRLNELKNKN